MDEIVMLLNMVMELVKNFGSMAPQAQISGVVLVVISMWKSSLVRPYWDKLGKYQVFVAPVLGLVYALSMLQPLSLANILVGLKGGMIAVAVHEMLDAMKKSDLIGPKYKAVIEFFEKIMFMPKKQEQIEQK